MTLTMAPGTNSYTGEDYVFTTPVTTRYLQIYVTSIFWTSDAYTGISEIRFIPVSDVPTTTTVASSANPSLAGSNVTFTATIVPASGSAVPTGTVLFKTNGVAIGDPIALASGVATLITNSLPHGSNTVTAEYGGAANFVGSTNSVVQVVNTPPVGQDITRSAQTGHPATVQIIGGASAPTDAEGDPLTVTAAGPAADGTVSTDGTNVTYTSANSFAGTNIFSYTVSDNYGGSCTNTITVQVVDTTAPLAAPTMLSGQALGDGTFQLTFSGPSNQTYQVLASPEVGAPLAGWPALTNGTFGAGPVIYTDTRRTNATQFYRIVSP